MRKVYFFLLTVFVTSEALGQFSLILPGTYIQDFNGLGINTSTGVTGGDLSNVNLSLNGWFFSELPTSDLQITAGTGSLTTGDTYNFGTTAAADRTLGGLQSGALNPTIGFYFTNNTGSIITSLTINYTGEQWRLGTIGRVDRLDFQYSLNATSLITGLWVDADALDITAPVTTAPTGFLNGNLPANRTAITNTIIGLSIPNNTTFFIRWNDFNATGSEDGVGIDDFSLTAGFAAASTDHFRSITSGNWGTLSTWESSSDNILWGAATAIPTSSANTISIRNTHIVTFNSFLAVDEVVIETGGTLDFNNGILTVNDGTGNDIDIQNNGALVLSSASNQPAFTGANPTINIQGSGILRVSASGLTITPSGGVHANNYVYQHQSILEYTLTTAFGTVGVIYFPNANASTIPVFRITQSIPLPVGSTSTTIINGVFEANGNVTFTNSGTKTFRNGLRGTGNINESSSGKFIINGLTAEIGGTGSLTVPVTDGIEIGSVGGTTVTIISTKTITGNVTLVPTNTFVELGNNDLTITGVVSGEGINSYFRTNGAGVLTLNNVTLARTFPIGNSSYNPLVISNGNGANYSARVENGIVPALALPIYGVHAINRTWNIQASANTNANVVFQYAGADANPGVAPNEQMEILKNDGVAWNIITGNTNIIPAGTNPYTVNSATALTINSTTSTPYLIGKTGGYVLPLDYFITTRAQKINNTAIINWKVFDEDNVNSFEVQRSVNNGGFQTIAIVNPVSHQLEYSYTDAGYAKGINLYRIKVNRLSGGQRYSNTVAVINDTNGLLITSIVPNPAHSQAMLTLSTAKQENATLQVFDITGKMVKQWQTTIAAGTNTIPVTVSELQVGVYHLVVFTQDAKTVYRFVKQ